MHKNHFSLVNDDFCPITIDSLFEELSKIEPEGQHHLLRNLYVTFGICAEEPSRLLPELRDKLKQLSEHVADESGLVYGVLCQMLASAAKRLDLSIPKFIDQRRKEIAEISRTREYDLDMPDMSDFVKGTTCSIESLQLEQEMLRQAYLLFCRKLLPKLLGRQAI